MKKMIKSYGVFLPPAYKIWGIFLIPLFFFFILLLLVKANALAAGPSCYIITSYVIAFEVMADYWVFGGTCVKNNSSMEYLKTSLKGLGILGKGLAGDCIRRSVYFALLTGVMVYGGLWKYAVAMMLLADIVGTTALLIGRHFDFMFLMQMAVASIASVAFMILGQLLFWMMEIVPGDGKNLVAVIQIIVLAVIALAVNILAVSHGVGWVKGSYYERESD
ncbi:MAG: hypothetical protein SO130_06270 [Agathobacter sp.]|nr:hypothetical protein [Agathobacter sp.]